jgi:type II secretory pathway component PulK
MSAPNNTSQPNARRAQRGIVLALVLVIGLLLTTAIVAFQRRYIIDAQIAINRDQAAQAEALARGGIQLGIFLILADELAGDDAPPGDTHLDAWAQTSSYQVITPDNGLLRVRILDDGSRLNLNALAGSSGEEADEQTIDFLIAFFEKVIDELPIAPGERIWDERELAQNFIDYVDVDEERQRGGDENAWYESQNPPYTAPNQPLRTVDELAMVEGFTGVLVDGIRPYVTVHPRIRASGINLNTAPPHVLAAVYHGNQGDLQLANEDTVRRILKVREDGNILCSDTASDDRCILASEIVEGSVFPDAQQPGNARVFTVEADATVGEIRRSIHAVIDRTQPSNPVIVEWRKG